MSNKFTDFIKEHLSKNMMNIFIPIFVSLGMNFFSEYKQYGHKQEFNQILNKKLEIDSIKSRLIDDSINKHKRIKYSEMFVDILDNQKEVTPIILKSINHYNYNNISVDSLMYYAANLQLINSKLPMYIGKVDAYSNVDISGRNAEKGININLLKSEYELNKDLIQFLKGSKGQNQITTDKVNNFTSALSAFETFHTDSLNIVNDNFDIPNISQIKDDIDDLRDTYLLMRRLYLIGMIACAVLTSFLVFYFIKFNYHK